MPARLLILLLLIPSLCYAGPGVRRFQMASNGGATYHTTTYTADTTGITIPSDTYRDSAKTISGAVAIIAGAGEGGRADDNRNGYAGDMVTQDIAAGVTLAVDIGEGGQGEVYEGATNGAGEDTTLTVSGGSTYTADGGNNGATLKNAANGGAGGATGESGEPGGDGYVTIYYWQ